jgi:hypothetical protein
MGKMMKKLFNQSTRPGKTKNLGSLAVTGIAPGEAGTNTGQRRPGRRNADTPLGPKRMDRL